jgi:hypothetical protein
MTVAGLFCGAMGWAALVMPTACLALYGLYAAAGVGATRLVYCGSMGVALKWFPVNETGTALPLPPGSGQRFFIPIIAHCARWTTAPHSSAWASGEAADHVCGAVPRNPAGARFLRCRLGEAESPPPPRVSLPRKCCAQPIFMCSI